jgi:anti-anti-sigma factor
MQAAQGTVRAVRETDEIVAVCLESEFDMSNAPALVEQIDHAILDNNHLIVDLSKSTFIDSTVIEALFHAAREAKAKERTVVLQLSTDPIVERLIEITEIERVMPRTRSRAEAIQLIEQSTG